MKLSVILNTFNEGGRVASTCQSFLDNGADEVVVCADGTTDGSCDALPPRTVVVRHERPLGCGKSKISATMAATGDVFMWADAHQCVLSGDLRKFAEEAHSTRRIMCPPLKNIFYTESWEPKLLVENSRSFYPNDAALLPDSTSQYKFEKPGYGHMVGVGLCMSRKTYWDVGGWNNFKGRHGSQERGMALRAFMADVPVTYDSSLVLGHEFFGDTHPSRNSRTGQYQFNNIVPASVNVWHAYMAVTSPFGFSSQIAPWLRRQPNGEKGSPAEQLEEAQQDRDYFLRHCKRLPDEALFSFLNELSEGRTPVRDTGGASLEPAALTLIGAASRGRCLELGTGSGAGTKVLLSGAAQVVSVDHMPRYSSAAAAAVNDSRAKFVVCPLNADGFYDLSHLSGKFDLILVDGPPGTKARRTSVESVLPFLAEGGIVLIDDAKRDWAHIESSCALAGRHLKLLPTNRGLAEIR